MTVLSTSVFSPFGDQPHLLAGHVGTSRTMRLMRWNTGLTGWARMAHHAVLDFPGQLLKFLKAHIDGRRAGIVAFDDALGQHGLV